MGRKEKEDRDHERERDRDRDARKRRHRGASSRSRSRSKSRERDHSKKIKVERDAPSEKYRDHEKDRPRDTREKERPKKIKEEKPPTSDVPESLDKGKKQKPKHPETEITVSATSESSLSIEETNRIRAELGLKPLDLGGDSGSSETSTKKEDVHVPAENIGQKKATEELRRRIDEKREKRKIEQKFEKAKELGEASDEDDSAASWVEKLRQIQQQKEEAAKRAKMLEEMDEALGEAGKKEASKPPPKAYTSRDLQGIRVEHDREAIAEEKTVILTLKDQNVLDEEADVLVNVNIMDEERYKKNNEIKKQKPGYQPFEEEFDELGLPKKKSLLAKYDVEIEGDKKESFVIGHDADEEAKRAKELIKEKLQQQQKRLETLESRPLQMASEYFTPEEMVSFKKVKRRVKKVRSKTDQVLKADDLLAAAPEEATTSDLGSRNRRIKTEPDDDVQVPTEDLSEVKIVNDDTAPEERLALNKVKRFKEKVTAENKWDLNEIAMTIKQEPTDEPEPMEEDNARSSIVLNATAEFCRTLGDIPTYGLAGNRDEDQEDLLDFERQLAEERRKNQEKEERKREAERRKERSGWKGVDEPRDDSDDSMETDQNEQDVGTVILDEEPDVGSGVAAALKLAMNKGYLEKEEKKRVALSKAAQELTAQRYTIEDKAAEDDKYSRRNRFDGPVSEFKDKEGYKPQFKLEYVDDGGKHMNEKEAFRFLSHKFHGKGSGKLKSEKRAKKQEEKMLMNRMSSTDTPLNTLKKLQDKQKELQSPYVVLSGKNATTSIAKPTKPGKGKK